MIGGLSRNTPGSLFHHGTCRIARGYLETVFYRCHNIVLTDRIIIGRSVVTTIVVFTVVIIEVERCCCRVELEVNDINPVRTRPWFQSGSCAVSRCNLEPSVSICSTHQGRTSGVVSGGYYRCQVRWSHIVTTEILCFSNTIGEASQRSDFDIYRSIIYVPCAVVAGLQGSHHGIGEVNLRNT